MVKRYYLGQRLYHMDKKVIFKFMTEADYKTGQRNNTRVQYQGRDKYDRVVVGQPDNVRAVYKDKKGNYIKQNNKKVYI